MARKRSRPTDACEPASAPRPAWRLPEPAAPPEAPSGRARWLLAAAVSVQIAWIAALAAMAWFVRWRA